MHNRMLRIFFLGVLIFKCFTIFAYTVHTNKEYVDNPEFALQDAEWYEKEGDIPKSIICYKKYAALTGKDMSLKIDYLNNQKYPDWFDFATMKAVHLPDGEVIIIYAQLMRSSVWSIKKNNNIPGITGKWNVSVNDTIFDAIRQCDLRIPEDGLFKCINSLESFSRFGNDYSVSKKQILNLKTNNGTSEIEISAHTEVGNLNNGKQTANKIKDSKKEIDVYFYLTRIIKKNDGLYQILDLESKTKNVKAEVNVNLDVKTIVPRSSYCK